MTTFRQLLEEDRVYRVVTRGMPWYYWNKNGEKKESKKPYDWEDGCMTKEEAFRVEREADIKLRIEKGYMSYDQRYFIRPWTVTYRDTIERLAAREDPNDIRSINERRPDERMLPPDNWIPPSQRKEDDGIPLWVNIILGIPLLLLRSALKH